MRRHLWTLWLPLALTPVGGHALGFQGERLQLHGFASQVVLQTSDNRYFGESTKTSFDFTELGLNASFQAQPEILLAGQILSRRAGEMYDGAPSLDYALADVTLTSSAQYRLGFRAGRIKIPLGLYNETRDVPFTRPGIFLPQVVYYDKVRNLELSTDGVMLFGEIFRDRGNMSLVIGGGRAVIDDNVEWTYLGNDYPGELEPNGMSWMGSLWYTSPAECLKLGLSAAVVELSYDARPNSPVDGGGIDFVNWIASAQYNLEDWTLSAEYSRIPVEWRDFGPAFPFHEETVEGYYLQAAYRVSPQIELMLRYEEGFADDDDRDGNRSSALTGGVTPAYDFYSKIWSAGVRWDIAQNIMLRLEYQRHQGTFALAIRENTNPSDLVKDWNAIAASISLRF